MARKKHFFLILFAVLGLLIMSAEKADDPGHFRISAAVSHNWNRFLGGAPDDRAYHVVVGPSGDIYVTGSSNGSWGTPIRPHSGTTDGFIARFTPAGQMVWLTFVGGGGTDSVNDPHFDASGRLIVAGSSSASWGTPLNPFTPGGAEAFVAAFNSSGTLLWHTFLGSSSSDGASAVTTDASGNIYLAGASDATWGSPVRAHAGGAFPDAFVAKLDSSANLVWHTFLGGSHMDFSLGIGIDNNRNVYVGGRSVDTWGSPITDQAGYGTWDAFAARLDTNGNLVWNTFLGQPNYCYAFEKDDRGYLYWTGLCYASFGNPVNPYLNNDIYVVKMDLNGSYVWNTFLGSASSNDQGEGITVDRNGEVFVVARCDATWGTPVRPHAGGRDGMVARLSSTGHLRWHSFMGSSGTDYANDAAVSNSGRVFVVGESDATWGAPLSPYAGTIDGFVAAIDQNLRISGSVMTAENQPVPGVAIVFSEAVNDELTNTAGRYGRSIAYGWSGTVTPQLEGYRFEPEQRSYRHITWDQTGQDFTAIRLPMPRLSGVVVDSSGFPLKGVVVTITGLGQEIVTGEDGTFAVEVPYGWSGTITPGLPLYDFTPASLSYSDVRASTPNISFTGEAVLSLSASRSFDRAWFIQIPYNKIRVNLTRNDPAVQKWVLLRGKAGGPLTPLQEFSSANFNNNAWTYIDKDIDNGVSYIYQIVVYDSQGVMVYRSPEVSIP